MRASMRFGGRLHNCTEYNSHGDDAHMHPTGQSDAYLLHDVVGCLAQQKCWHCWVPWFLLRVVPRPLWLIPVLRWLRAQLVSVKVAKEEEEAADEHRALHVVHHGPVDPWALRDAWQAGMGAGKYFRGSYCAFDRKSQRKGMERWLVICWFLLCCQVPVETTRYKGVETGFSPFHYYTNSVTASLLH